MISAIGGIIDKSTDDIIIIIIVIILNLRLRYLNLLLKISDPILQDSNATIPASVIPKHLNTSGNN